jgi:hypothetical protein
MSANTNPKVKVPDPDKDKGGRPGVRGRQAYRSPLSVIEFDAASDIVKYAEVMRIIGRTEQLELHTAADELQAILSHSAGTFFERVAARRKAKKVANQIRKAADHARGMAVQGVRLRRTVLGEYAPLLNPGRTNRKKVLNWKA